MSAASPAVAVSSSSTLWATASKEWVIPAKPKPGRKPKKDVAPPVQDEGEVDSKGRRVQNRAAQRAFRERKQSQLAELQARVQQYEQGEIERNVALQNIAKRLKEENEKLRKENALLKERVMQFENERAASKRSREESHPLSPTDASDYPARKRTKSSDPLTSLPPASTMPISYASSPSSMASSPESSDAHSSFSPVPFAPTSRDTGIFGQGFSLSSVFDLASEKINLFEPGGSLDTFDCGFCNENTPCVCRELTLQQMTVSNASSLKLENIERVLAQPQVSPSPAPARPSILDNLPAFQAAVPSVAARLTPLAAHLSHNIAFPRTAEHQRAFLHW
ncbi:hypothetical protein A0H81_00885 [Grifola frondosa]|uniref:BZIP domain-containing protein n=1 Tax=Grifola frondosa TaxID=5627 RepID=A0A1C7MQZ7_GRIFR|nr:hypothetical protein A0H81_00885 [Grifola frondosa]